MHLLILILMNAVLAMTFIVLLRAGLLNMSIAGLLGDRSVRLGDAHPEDRPLLALGALARSVTARRVSRCGAIIVPLLRASASSCRA